MQTLHDRRWRAKVNIKQFIGKDQENESPAHCHWVASSIAGEMRKLEKRAEGVAVIGINFDFSFLEAVESLEEITVDQEDALAALNGALSLLYDWADAERVWLGLL